ncbi:MAG: amidohydrolase family protein [Methanoregula sp.]|jgi:N-acyl-D-aspartate/D-glutamate deacylase
MTDSPPADALKNLVIFIIALALITTSIVQVLLLSNASHLPVPHPDYDIIIRGGTVYDGSLKEPTRVDIGIKGDKISAVGNLAGRTATKEIDANGRIVTPGFIDVHTHSDLSFKLMGILGNQWDNAAEIPELKGNYNFLLQGVTTVVTGNCGYGYSNISEWFGLVDTLGFGTNVYHLAPYGAMRQELFGEDHLTVLNKSERSQMEALLAREMEHGATGFSAGLGYSPDYLATKEELIGLAKVAKRYNGVFAVHIRDYSGTVNENGESRIFASIEEAIEIGRQAGIPVQISHIQLTIPYGNVTSEQILAPVRAARSEGLDISMDQHAYDASLTTLTSYLPGKYASGFSVADEYKTDEGKAQIRAEIGKLFTSIPPDKWEVGIFLAKPEYQMKTIQEIADSERRDPRDVFVDLVTADMAALGMVFEMNRTVNEEIMAEEFVFTASDGYTSGPGFEVPHPRAFGTFPHKIRTFALQEKRLNLTAAIRSMTSLPAEKFHMNGRGRIAEGYYADIVVINLSTFSDRSTYREPGLYPDGLDYILVNGVVSQEQGKPAGNTGGMAVRQG